MIFSSVSFSKLWIQPNIQSSFIDSSLLMPNSITLMIQMPLLRVTSKTPSPTISRALCTSYYCFTQLNYWSFQNTHTHTLKLSKSSGYLKFLHIFPAPKNHNFFVFFFSCHPYSINKSCWFFHCILSLLFHWPQISLITSTLVSWFLPFLLLVSPINWVPIIFFLKFHIPLISLFPQSLQWSPILGTKLTLLTLT